MGREQCVEDRIFSVFILLIYFIYFVRFFICAWYILSITNWSASCYLPPRTLCAPSASGMPEMSPDEQLSPDRPYPPTPFFERGRITSIACTNPRPITKLMPHFLGRKFKGFRGGVRFEGECIVKLKFYIEKRCFLTTTKKFIALCKEIPTKHNNCHSV